MITFGIREEKYMEALSQCKNEKTFKARMKMEDWPHLVSGVFAPKLFLMLVNQDPHKADEFFEEIFQLYENEKGKELVNTIFQAYITSANVIPYEVQWMCFDLETLMSFVYELILDFDELIGWYESIDQ